ncbi:MAG: insulinase family protein [Ectothiorhodospiraceae bacterium]|nr:insulinase family protein [Ectothiorhodospiraceae bacterium]
MSVTTPTTTTTSTKSTHSVDSHPNFRHLRRQSIESLGLEIDEFEHRQTGAKHYHLAADNNENVFLVALRTVPTDSSGVAHILEHTALCGSERYPVRDPFFMMIRRSLNTFMNAFTSSDWTAYPFASQNRKDFFNLLDVYLDAVFFSNLDKLDFAQEGHRIEFETADDPTSDLTFKGVVFNEMKGAMSSPISTLWQAITKYTFPTNTYHFNSGGEPADIPDLSYDELQAFYKKHYHPSNAVFMTYGNIPATELQQQFEDRVLNRFKHADSLIQVPAEKRFVAPINVEEFYPLDESEQDGNKTHVIMSWLLGPATDLHAALSAELLEGVLLEDSASPLRHALETTKLSTAPSPLCGLDNSNKEMTFLCGLEGCSAEDTQAIETLILTTLQNIVKDGVPQQSVEAVLHQLEMEQREIGGGSYPYGLQLILDALSTAIHYGDALAALNLTPVLEKLREDIKDPQFIPNLIQTLLLDNPHRIRLTLKPDGQFAARRDAAESARLAHIKSTLNDEEKQNIVALAKQLEERQNLQDDESILPKVGLEDVPEKLNIATGTQTTVNGRPTHSYEQGTNGLVYQQLIVDLPKMDDELLAVMPYYTSCLTELGCGDRDYLTMQAQQSSVSGGIGAYTSLRGKIDNEQSTSGHFILSGKALSRNHRAFNQLAQDIFHTARFDEHNRIRELMAQLRAGREQSITGRGHALAMQAAAAGMSPAAALKQRLSGLTSITSLKQLDDTLDDQKAISQLAEKMSALHDLLQSCPSQFLLIGEKDSLADLQEDCNTVWPSPADAEFTPFFLPEKRESVNELWTTSTSVNFCAKAYPTVPAAHPDAPALAVLSGFLRNGFLHRVIREQGGAYGGGASHDSDSASFRFYSYRDPRLTETLNDFDRSIDWLLNEKHQWRQVEESILGVIGSLDKPSSPSGEAKDAFHSALYGRTAEQRQQQRQRVLAVTLEDLKRVGETYLKPELASTAVITNPQSADSAETLGLTIRAL